MPPRDWSIRIKDILAAVRKVKRYTDDILFESFEQDEKTIDAVIRNFMVIGEAAAHVPPTIRKQYPAVPWTQIIGMRNLVVHQYFGVSLAIVWATARNRLPELEVALQAAVKAPGGHPKKKPAKKKAVKKKR